MHGLRNVGRFFASTARNALAVGLPQASKFITYTTARWVVRIRKEISLLSAENAIRRSTSLGNPAMIAYDPQKDAIYDLEHGIEKTLFFHDGAGNVALTEAGDPLRLFQMWNAGATGTRNITPAHPQYVMGEVVDMLVAINMTRSGHMKPRDMRVVVAGQFAIGLGQFLTKRGLHVRVHTRKLGEVELIEIKKKFSDDT